MSGKAVTLELFVVIGPPPKSMVFWKSPVSTTLPPESTATLKASSAYGPPKRFAQRYAPAGEYLATKMSRLAAVRGPPPKSVVPAKEPVTITLPLASTATL